MNTNQHPPTVGPKFCAFGHLIRFEKKDGLIVCSCARCAKKTGSIFRGHALNEHDAYLRYLTAVACW